MDATSAESVSNEASACASRHRRSHVANTAASQLDSAAVFSGYRSFVCTSSFHSTFTFNRHTTRHAILPILFSPMPT